MSLQPVSLMADSSNIHQDIEQQVKLFLKLVSWDTSLKPGVNNMFQMVFLWKFWLEPSYQVSLSKWTSFINCPQAC
jgi:hypothetical protein